MNPFLKAKQWLLHGGSFQLRPYESDCLAAWKATLSHDGARLLEEQLRRLNVYQRYSDERLLCFYDVSDKACAKWPKEILFPCQLEEVAVARLQLRPVAEPKRVIKADIQLYRGRFFGFEFSRSPKCFRDGYQILKVNSLIDPMRQSKATTPISLSEVPNELQQLLLMMGATDLRKPASPEEREARSRTIDAKLPDDYIKLISGTDGATVNRWRIYGLSEIRRIVQPDDNFYLLAEATDGRALGVVQETDDAQLYIVSPEDETAEATNQSLLRYIELDLAAPGRSVG